MGSNKPGSRVINYAAAVAALVLCADVVGISGQYGRAAASIAGTLTAIAGPIVVTRTGMLEGSLTSYGDLAPFAELLWNHGVNNYMAYVTGNVPVGDYDPTRIPNIGLGHGAIDIGGAYTYFDPAAGNEISGVAGLTYNFRNPDTQYRSGIDFHFDWGASHYLTKQLFVGIAGYAYQQITDDSGQNPILGGSGHAFSASVRKSGTASRSETCRAPLV